ncbi:hypothetical protein CALK_0708 [Chitinivibrio alkaliphilus ACht1]|uniref:Uncharacterized protein n=2 Tax=Chitinivibrio TaxID=1505231 RepID=U7DCR7_9BACT|nr:hypothetical protein CALK_0708 [Chitinivibrio alkaliphilus ACht1]
MVCMVYSLDDTGLSSFDEIPVSVSLDRHWGFEVFLLITEDFDTYIHMEDLFSQLDLYYEKHDRGRTISGWIENQGRTYRVSHTDQSIIFEDKTYAVGDELILYNDHLYIKNELLGEIFGIHTDLNIRNFRLSLQAEFELPRFKEMRLQRIREEALRMQGKDFVPDTVYERIYNWAVPHGHLQWSYRGRQSTDNAVSNTVGIGLGTELLGGETTIQTSFSDQQPWHQDNLSYQWRWADDSKNLVRQVVLGRIGAGTVSSQRIHGARITNSPITQKRSTGQYIYSGYTEPHWLVELYLNGTLIDVATADPAGVFVFDVPIMQGRTDLKTIAYGPSGEEEEEYVSVNTPYAVMGLNTFRYTLSGGALYDDDGAFMQGSFHYGLNRYMTLSGGLEYLNDTTKESLTPYSRVAFQPNRRFFCVYERIYEQHDRFSLNLRLSPRFSVMNDATVYHEENRSSQATHSWGSRVHIPYRISPFSGFVRTGIGRTYYSSFERTEISGTLSLAYGRFRSSSIIRRVEQRGAHTNYQQSLSYRTSAGLSLRSSVYCDLTQRKWQRVTMGASKRLSKGILTAQVEHALSSGSNTVSLTYNYDFPALRTTYAAHRTPERIQFSQSASGSVLLGGSKKASFTHEPSLRRGTAVLQPFLDRNYSHQFDPGDSLLFIPVATDDRSLERGEELTRIPLTSSFTRHDISLKKLDLPYIGWEFPFEKIRVEIDPHQEKTVYIPVHVVGEVTGSVSIDYPRRDERPLPMDDTLLLSVAYESEQIYLAEAEYRRIREYQYLVENNPKAEILLVAQGTDTLLQTHRLTALAQLLEDRQFITKKQIAMKRAPHDTTEQEQDAWTKKEEIKVFLRGADDFSVPPPQWEQLSSEERSQFYTRSAAGRMPLTILDETGRIIETVSTEGDGYYSYMGLLPGTYSLRPCLQTLYQRGFYIPPQEIPTIEIEAEYDGDFVDGVDLTVVADTPAVQVAGYMYHVPDRSDSYFPDDMVRTFSISFPEDTPSITQRDRAALENSATTLSSIQGFSLRIQTTYDLVLSTGGMMDSYTYQEAEKTAQKAKDYLVDTLGFSPEGIRIQQPRPRIMGEESSPHTAVVSLGVFASRRAVQDIPIEIVDHHMQPVTVIYTDSTGYYSFGGLPPGEYTLRSVPRLIDETAHDYFTPIVFRIDPTGTPQTLSLPVVSEPMGDTGKDLGE